MANAKHKALETHIKEGNWQRGWGSRHRIDKVYRGKLGHIGNLQTVRRGGRTESTTHNKGAAVLGHDLKWLEREAQNKKK